MTKAGTDWTWNGHSALPAKKHGLLFASQAQTQNIVLKQMKTATESLGATWEVKKMKALPQNCSKIDVHWAMPGIPGGACQWPQACGDWRGRRRH
jgi:hypothetical protein